MFGGIMKSACLLFWMPSNTAIVSDVPGRSWAQVTSDLRHYHHVHSLKLTLYVGEEGKHSA